MFLCWDCIYQPVSPSSPTPLCGERSLLGDLGVGEVVSSARPLLPSLETLEAGPPKVTGMCVLHRYKIRHH